MEIFIDTAKIEEIEQSIDYGIVDGVTTNPSLIKEAILGLQKKTDFDSYIKKILATAKGKPVSLEIIGTSYREMLEQAKRIYKKYNPVANNVVIKIPINPSFEIDSETEFHGLRVIRELSKIKIPSNCTLIMTPEQALVAAKAGAKYISPFVGRIDDFIRTNNNIEFQKSDYFPSYGWKNGERMLDDNGIISGIELLRECIKMMQKYNFKSKVIAASIRNARQFREVALVGVAIATIPYYVLKELIRHYKTREGVKKFTQDIVAEYSEMFK